MAKKKKPAGKKPARKKPATKKPATKKPATKKPATKKPARKKPSREEPARQSPTGVPAPGAPDVAGAPELALRVARGELAANELRFAARHGEAAAIAVLGADAPGPSQRIQLRRWSDAPCSCPTLVSLIVERITGRHRPELEGRPLLLVSDIAGDTLEWTATSAYALLDRLAEQVWEQFHDDAEVDFEIAEEETGGDPDGEDLRELGPRLFLHWWLSGKANEGCRCAPGSGSFKDDPRGALVVGWDTMPPVFEASWAILDPSDRGE